MCHKRSFVRQAAMVRSARARAREIREFHGFEMHRSLRARGREFGTRSIHGEYFVRSARVRA